MTFRRVNAAGHLVPGSGFTHAVVAAPLGRLVFVSGLTSRGPDGTVQCEGDVAGQVGVIFATLRDILVSAGGSLDNVLALQVYLRDVEQWPAVEAAYKANWPDGWPSSTCVQIVRLVDERQLVEITATAQLPARHLALLPRWIRNRTTRKS
jgi:2-iminobutanoate/2-iminopropanoate deaminase